MNFELMSGKFELPKSPAPTLRDEDSNDDDDDVEYLGTIEPPNVIQTKLGGNGPLSDFHPNLMPTLLATPPLSPMGMNVQQSNMPLLTAMLSQNNPANPLTGYTVQIPCFLCKQPFYDINGLREHLTMHATQMNIHVNPGPVDAPYPCPLPIGMDKDIAAPGLQCEYCPRIFKSQTTLNAHLKYHRLPFETSVKKASKKQYKCHICKKSYKRDTFLVKHMHIKHGEQCNITAPPTTLRQGSPPRPGLSTEEADCDRKPRFVWNTKLLNAVAAANYSPATESAAKYVPPTEVPNQKLDPCLLPPAKQKYALRSPYFNPNLWVDYDAYI